MFIAGAAVNMLLTVWSQSRWPSCAWDREALQDRLIKVQRVRPGVDQEVRHVNSKKRPPNSIWKQKTTAALNHSDTIFKHTLFPFSIKHSEVSTLWLTETESILVWKAWSLALYSVSFLGWFWLNPSLISMLTVKCSFTRMWLWNISPNSSWSNYDKSSS